MFGGAKGRTIVKKNGENGQIFIFRLDSPLIQKRVGKDGKAINQKEKKSMRKIETISKTLTDRGAASRAAKGLFKNVLINKKLTNKVTNSSKKLKMVIKFHLVRKIKHEEISYEYDCEGLINPKKKKVIKTKGKNKEMMVSDYQIKVKLVKRTLSSKLTEMKKKK